jgi:TetR/AcrR family transcriptional repressor of nem operon
MPRVSKFQTDKNRTAIELAAVQLLLEHGLHNVSVADVMAAAGLTHGGFYGHFDSKDALAMVACNKAFALSDERRSAKVARHPGDPAAALSEITCTYLGAEHRDNPGGGCPALALAADVAREPADKPVRAAYVTGLREMLASYEALAPAGPDGTSSAKAAMLRMALLVGTLTLARATSGDPLSEAFLEAGRAWQAGQAHPAQ